MKRLSAATLRLVGQAVTATVFTLTLQTASAVPVYFAGTGNTYDFIAGSRTWDAAKTDAESLGGHLTTITSAAEDTFIRTTFAAQISGIVFGPWFGADHDGSAASGAIGGWSWVTGEAFLYTGWNAGEPNRDSGGGEGIHFSRGGWNDIPRNTLNPGGYLIEYEVPEPATLLLMGLGLAGVGFHRRKAR